MEPEMTYPKDQDLALMVDLYELAMAQAYWSENMHETAVFSLFFRELPGRRNFVLACGQQQVARVIQSLRFTDDHLRRLESLGQFQPEFLHWLKDFRFSGDVHALPEGAPVFPQEPMMEVEAPIVEAQILETLVMNYVHLESVLASKAARVVLAAGGKPVVDFGMRRMHGLDSAYRGVRAYRMAGLAGTSNILAGQDFGLSVRGTMAHSFIQAHSNELDAFKTYAGLYPGTVLLVDTYDTEAAIRHIIEWLKQDDEARVSAIRLDSGDLGAEARLCRQLLDEAGLKEIRILASGGLDENKIHQLVQDQAPVDGFGVGTDIGVAKDSPSIDLAYKLTQYANQPRMKSSTGKTSYPGRKQVYRETDSNGYYCGDHLTLRDEKAPGDPLLKATLRAGDMVEGAIEPLDHAAPRTQDALRQLPQPLRELTAPTQEYPVTISKALKNLQRETLDHIRRQQT